MITPPPNIITDDVLELTEQSTLRIFHLFFYIHPGK